jgi:hypothetical protein
MFWISWTDSTNAERVQISANNPATSSEVVTVAAVRGQDHTLGGGGTVQVFVEAA